MESAEKLRELLEKLRRNKEKIPLATLKTRYKAAYEKLIADIKTEAEALFLPAAMTFPDWIDKRRIKAAYADQIAEAFNKAYRDGGYAHRIGQALYKRYSAEELLQLAAEFNKGFQAAVIEIFHRATCLYTTAENWNPENPVIPRIYNDLVDKFYDEEAGEWRDPKPGEHENTLLIFIKGDKEEEKGGQSHETEQKEKEAPTPGAGKRGMGAASRQRRVDQGRPGGGVPAVPGGSGGRTGV